MAKNTPAFQFYPSDFICGTMLLSPEATGAYIRILCVLWMEGNRLGGKANVKQTPKQNCSKTVANCFEFCYDTLQSITQTNGEQFARIWSEIEGKFEITDGMLSHPRFTKMMEISEKRRESGGLGGRKKKQNESKSSSNESSKPPSKNVANSRRMKNEDRSMKNEVLNTKEKSDYPDDFEKFWAAFPEGRKTKKRSTFQTWTRAIKRASAETILAAAIEYAKSDKGQGEFVQGPEPWLNGDCWDDNRDAWKDIRGNPNNRRNQGADYDPNLTKEKMLEGFL